MQTGRRSRLQTPRLVLWFRMKTCSSEAPQSHCLFPTYPLLRRAHQPIEACALAAHHTLKDTVVAVCTHLLAYVVSKLSDELPVKMRLMYFDRLSHLQRARLAALKDIVSSVTPPLPHRPH
ncbi:hypothetical protein C8Q77DRAFT_812275 [Trametes polyzona]|nr:hypothetical protein C8Q77DRAFT_812275 [Trametes polyzona]